MTVGLQYGRVCACRRRAPDGVVSSGPCVVLPEPTSMRARPSFAKPLQPNATCCLYCRRGGVCKRNDAGNRRALNAREKIFGCARWKNVTTDGTDRHGCNLALLMGNETGAEMQSPRPCRGGPPRWGLTSWGDGYPGRRPDSLVRIRTLPWAGMERTSGAGVSQSQRQAICVPIRKDSGRGSGFAPGEAGDEVRGVEVTVFVKVE